VAARRCCHHGTVSIVSATHRRSVRRTPPAMGAQWPVARLRRAARRVPPPRCRGPRSQTSAKDPSLRIPRWPMAGGARLEGTAFLRRAPRKPGRRRGPTPMRRRQLGAGRLRARALSPQRQGCQPQALPVKVALQLSSQPPKSWSILPNPSGPRQAASRRWPGPGGVQACERLGPGRLRAAGAPAVRAALQLPGACVSALRASVRADQGRRWLWSNGRRDLATLPVPGRRAGRFPGSLCRAARCQARGRCGRTPQSCRLCRGARRAPAWRWGALRAGEQRAAALWAAPAAMPARGGLRPLAHRRAAPPRRPLWRRCLSMAQAVFAALGAGPRLSLRPRGGRLGAKAPWRRSSWRRLRWRALSGRRYPG